MFKIDAVFIEKLKELYQSYENSVNERILHIKPFQVFSNKNLLFYASEYGNEPHKVKDKLISHYINSFKESSYGKFLENIAVYIIEIYLQGEKSTYKGIDVKFLKYDDIMCYVSVKSAPSWSNANAMKGLIASCKLIDKIARENDESPMFIDGCCTGKTPLATKTDKKSNDILIKLCGSNFWEFLTDDKEFYYKLLDEISKLHKIDKIDSIEKFNTMFDQFILNDKIDYKKIILANNKQEVTLGKIFEKFYQL